MLENLIEKIATEAGLAVSLLIIAVVALWARLGKALQMVQDLTVEVRRQNDLFWLASGRASSQDTTNSEKRKKP